jgi:hypothetical protein
MERQAHAIHSHVPVARPQAVVVLQELLGLAVFFKPDHLAIHIALGEAEDKAQKFVHIGFRLK